MPHEPLAVADRAQARNQRELPRAFARQPRKSASGRSDHTHPEHLSARGLRKAAPARNPQPQRRMATRDGLHNGTHRGQRRRLGNIAKVTERQVIIVRMDPTDPNLACPQLAHPKRQLIPEFRWRIQTDEIRHQPTTAAAGRMPANEVLMSAIYTPCTRR